MTASVDQSLRLDEWLKSEHFEEALWSFLNERIEEEIELVSSFDQAITLSDLSCVLDQELDTVITEEQCLVFGLGAHTQDFQGLRERDPAAIDLAWNFTHVHADPEKPWSEDKTTLLKQAVLTAFKEYAERFSFKCLLPPDESIRIELIDPSCA